MNTKDSMEQFEKRNKVWMDAHKGQTVKFRFGAIVRESVLHFSALIGGYFVRSGGTEFDARITEISEND